LIVVLPISSTFVSLVILSILRDRVVKLKIVRPQRTQSGHKGYKEFKI